MLNLRLDMIKSCEIPISDGYTEYSSLFSTKPSDQKLDDDLKKYRKSSHLLVVTMVSG
jgi:hypothetical protein